jgi:hypothetical protein
VTVNKRRETKPNELHVIPNISAQDQACIHIKASTMFGASLLRCGLMILPLVLKTDSDATVVTGIVGYLEQAFSK